MKKSLYKSTLAYRNLVNLIGGFIIDYGLTEEELDELLQQVKNVYFPSSHTE